MPRKTLDGRKLAVDVAQFTAADKLTPPEARPSLMDAVRAFAGYIDTRAKLGWTDPMIAAVLTEAGYPIDAATLRSYRKRLRDEGRVAPKALPPKSAVHVPVDHTPAISEKLATADAVVVDLDGGADMASTKPEADNTAPRAPPNPAPASHRTFRIDPAIRPPHRA